MVNDFRGPLYVNRREVAPVLAVRVWALPVLLLTTLASLPAPFVNPPAPSAIHKPQPLNQDTSESTQKPLIADKQLPFQINVWRPSQWRPYLHQDTSEGCAKTLTADRQLPFQVNVWLGPQSRPYLPFDTALELQAVLRTILPPFVPPVWLPVIRPLQILDDTSSFAPVLLREQGTAPLVVPTWAQSPDWLYVPGDTSQGVSAVLRAVIPAPFVNPTWAPQPSWRWQPLDTSLAPPVLLREAGAAPVVVLTWTQTQRLYQPGDTSQGLPAVLQVVAAVPAVTQQLPLVEWPQSGQWDTSQSTSQALIAVAPAAPQPQPAFVVTPQPLSQLSQPGDTSQSVNADLFAPEVVVPPQPEETHTFIGPRSPQRPPRKPPGSILFTINVAQAGQTCRAVMIVEALIDSATFQVPASLQLEASASAEISVEVVQPPTPMRVLGSARAMFKMSTVQRQKPIELVATASANVVVKGGIEAEVIPTYDGPDGFDIDDFVFPSHPTQ